jgi:hypothetical protein
MSSRHTDWTDTCRCCNFLHSVIGCLLFMARQPQWAKASSLAKLHDHTQTRHSVGLFFFNDTATTEIYTWQHNTQKTHPFNVHGPLHRNNILVYKSQQDEQVTEFILPDIVVTVLCSKDGWYWNPKHVEQFSDKNKVWLVHLVGIYILEHTSMFPARFGPTVLVSERPYTHVLGREVNLYPFLSQHDNLQKCGDWS